MIERLRERLRLLWQEDRYRADIKQFVEFGLGYFVVLVVGYFLMRKINLTLSEEEMGRFSYVSSLIMIVAPVLCLAAPQAYLRFHDDHRISRRLKAFLMPAYCLSAVLSSAIVYFFTKSWLAIAYAAYPFFLERTYCLRAQMETRKLNVLRICEILVPLAMIFALSGRVDITANNVLFFYGVGYGLSLLFGSRRVSDVAFDRRQVLTFLIPLVFTTLLMLVIGNAAVVMAKQFLGYEAAGKMGVAVRSLIFIRSMCTLFLMFYPMTYFREARKGRFGIIRIYRLCCVGCVGVFALVLIVFAPFVYRVLGAEVYADSVGLFRILVASEFANYLIDIYGAYFGLEIKTWKTAAVKGVAFAVLALGFVLLPNLDLPSANRLTAIAWVILAAAAVSSAAGLFWALSGERKFQKGLSRG